MRPVKWLKSLSIILTTALLAAVAASSLPDDPYQRFSSLSATIQRRIQWIYERIHYDPTPIDVVILGPSRTGAGVDSRRLAADLARSGHRLAPVNFSLPENGRDLHWVIAKELLGLRRPKLIIIGVAEKPSRFGHPAYKYVAPAAAVVDPAYFGNLDYLENLAYLPYRQLRLTAARAFPAWFGLPAHYDPGRYAGTYNDGIFAFRNGNQAVDTNSTVDQAELERQVREYERGVRPPILGSGLADIEFGDERAYVMRIADAARARGIRVAFLFLPYYTGPSDIQERTFYMRYGPVIDASFVSTHDEWYSDQAHLNRAGAAALTDWLAPRIVALLGEGSA